MPVRLGKRYRAGRDGATIYFADGTFVQLRPFQKYRFEREPVRVVGTLSPVRPNGRVRLEHKA